MKLFRIATAALLFTWCLVCRADPVLPALFSNHMVLQQHPDIQVWGPGPTARIAIFSTKTGSRLRHSAQMTGAGSQALTDIALFATTYWSLKMLLPRASQSTFWNGLSSRLRKN